MAGGLGESGMKINQKVGIDNFLSYSEERMMLRYVVVQNN
jgi:hypothetical protein